MKGEGPWDPHTEFPRGGGHRGLWCRVGRSPPDRGRRRWFEHHRKAKFDLLGGPKGPRESRADCHGVLWERGHGEGAYSARAYASVLTLDLCRAQWRQVSS